MTQVSVGKLLPNIKVTLGNDNVDSDSSDVKEMTVDSKVEVVRPSVINPKVYMNKDGGFATGIDLIEQENSGILSKRAQRFGLKIEEHKPSISSLYTSMGIDIKNRDTGKMKKIRLDAIHVRGVEELSTEEVFTYFQDYGPSSIEWINDSACNVLYFDEESCGRALLGLSKPLPASFDSEILKTLKSSDDLDISSLELKDKMEAEEMEVDSSASDVDINIPVPPGLWRIGIPHSKAETIVLRFATKGDKKVPGAEKRSKFYKKYGNPNYGGLKGLISNSRKNKTQAAANRWAVEKESSFKSSFSSHKSNTPKASKPKIMRMRMYADDEELKTKKLRSKGHYSQRKGNVHSRLGSKYTADDLCRLGSYKDWDRSHDPMPQCSYNVQPKSSSWDLRSKLKKVRSDRIRDTYPVQSYRSSNRENAFESIKKCKQVYDKKKERRSFYKRKHRSPLCADDDDEDEEETSSSED